MSGHDLDRLLKFVGREPWSECFDEVLDAHFGALFESLDLTFEDLSEIIGEYQSRTLMGCVLEDFFTQSFEVEGGNVVDDYLKRRGWTESAGSKAYIKALRSSVMSLYEVAEVTYGKSFVVNDLIRGGKPVVVSELTATKTLQPGGKLAARIVSVLGRNIMAGGFLVYTPAAQENLFDGIREGAEYDGATGLPTLTDEDLRSLAPAFTIAWLIDTLKAANDHLLDLHNSDGEELVFHRIRFPFAAGVTQKDIGARLRTAPEFHSYRVRFWTWFDPNDDGHVVLGDIELKGRHLHLFVNSETRAEKGVAAVQHVLGDLVSAPSIDIVEPEEIMASRPDDLREAGESKVSPELVEQAIHQLIDRHYKASLDQPIAMLGNETPRQAAKTENGRRKIVDWLLHLEDEAARNGVLGSPIGSYNFDWMWRELDLERPRG